MASPEEVATRSPRMCRRGRLDSLHDATRIDSPLLRAMAPFTWGARDGIPSAKAFEYPPLGPICEMAFHYVTIPVNSISGRRAQRAGR
jgi:hypothetical protein